MRKGVLSHAAKHPSSFLCIQVHFYKLGVRPLNIALYAEVRIVLILSHKPTLNLKYKQLLPSSEPDCTSAEKVVVRPQKQEISDQLLTVKLAFFHSHTGTILSVLEIRIVSMICFKRRLVRLAVVIGLGINMGSIYAPTPVNGVRLSAEGPVKRGLSVPYGSRYCPSELSKRR